MERLVKFAENGGIVANKEVVVKETKQKNYVIEVAVADGIKQLAEEFDVKESRMIEEMYYTFKELLERGKQEQKKANTKAKKETKKETKAEDKEAK